MEEYEELREEHYAGQEERHYLPFEKASSKRKDIDFEKRPPVPPPNKPGITVVTGSYELDDVLDYIDWNPFFQVRLLRKLFCGSYGRVCCCCGWWFRGYRLHRHHTVFTEHWFGSGVFLAVKCRMSTSSCRLRVMLRRATRLLKDVFFLFASCVLQADSAQLLI